MFLSRNRNTTSDQSARQCSLGYFLICDDMPNLLVVLILSFQLLDSCLAPDTTGDGTGCDNMTVIIVLFNSVPDSTTKHNDKKRKQQEADLPDGESAEKRTKTNDS